MEHRKTQQQLLGLVCASCHAPNRDLKRCGGCERLWYCSASCSFDDWPSHREICGALVVLNRGEAPASRRSPSTPRQAYQCTENQLAALERELSRPPRDAEADFLWYGRRCAQCLHTPRQLAAGGWPEANAVLSCATGGFTPCPACLLTVCCSAECWGAHLTAHKPACRRLQARALSTSLWHSVVVQNASDREGVPVFVSAQRTVRQEPLPAAGWMPYFAARAAAAKGASTAPASATAGNPAFAFVTDALSKPLTVLRALERLIPRLELVQRERLIVHILIPGRYLPGRAQPAPEDCDDMDHPFELRDEHMWEEIFHLLPCLRLLHTVFVGPCMRGAIDARRHTTSATSASAAGGGHVGTDDGSGGGSSSKNSREGDGDAATSHTSRDEEGIDISTSTAADGDDDEPGVLRSLSYDRALCPQCKPLGAVRRVTLIHGAYEAWEVGKLALSRLSDAFIPPDLIVAFDARLHHPLMFPDWAPTLRHILSHPTPSPLLFTSGSSVHAVRDVEAMKLAMDGEPPAVLLGTPIGEDNPFVSLLWQSGVTTASTVVAAAVGSRGVSSAPRASRSESQGPSRADADPGTAAAIIAAGAGALQSSARSRNHWMAKITRSNLGALEPVYAPEVCFSPTAVTTLVRGMQAPEVSV